MQYLYKFISNENIIKIKDETEINVDIDKIAEESSLKGIFVKEILNDLHKGNINKKDAEEIIEIGLSVLK